MTEHEGIDKSNWGTFAAVVLEAEAAHWQAEYERLTTRYGSFKATKVRAAWKLGATMLLRRAERYRNHDVRITGTEATPAFPAADGDEPCPGCTGAGDCLAPAHQHGCFADLVGHCNEPEAHAEVAGEPEREALDVTGPLRRVQVIADMLDQGQHFAGKGWADDIRAGILAAAARQETEPRAPEREALRGAIGAVLCNSANYPERVAIRILGQDMGPLIDKTVDAVLATWPAREPELREVATVEWAVEYVTTGGLPSTGYNEFPDLASCERFMENPPMWFDPTWMTNTRIVSRAAASEWTAVTPITEETP